MHYNDSVSHPRKDHCLPAFIDLVHAWGMRVRQSSPVIVNGPVSQTPSLKRKNSGGTSTHTKKSATMYLLL